MAKVEFKEFDEYQKKLEELFKDTESLIKDAVYDGGKVVADEIKAGLKAIPIDNRTGTPENPLDGVTRQQKADLINGFGLAPMENKGGYINTKAGMDGYGSIPTKKYPNGLPNAMLMRSLESGTSFRKKHPVFRKAVNKARKRAVKAMEEKIDKAIKNRMEEQNGN